MADKKRDYYDGYIDGVEETFEAFSRAGVDQKLIYRAVSIMGISPDGRKRLWDKLNQIAACTEPIEQ